MTVNVVVPGAIGVPEITPVRVSIVRPAGNPDAANHALPVRATVGVSGAIGRPAWPLSAT